MKMEEKSQTVGVYIRTANTESSVEIQKETATQVAKMIFGPNTSLIYYIDEGIAGSNINGQHALINMMEDVKQGYLQAVIANDVSRLSRSLSDSIKLVEEIERANVRFISLK